MKKRINSTQRKKITRDRIQITVREDASFDLKLDLREMKFPRDARIIVEATCAGNAEVKRFDDIGILKDFRGGIVTCENTLSPFRANNFTFTIKIVDVQEEIGKILGFAKISASKKGGASLIALEVSDQLDHIPWQLDLDGDLPVLLVNEKYLGLARHLESDPVLQALILPGVFREVILNAIEEQDPEDDEQVWNHLLRLAAEIHPEKLPLPEDEDEEEQKQWVKDVVNAFCGKNHFLEVFQKSGWADVEANDDQR